MTFLADLRALRRLRADRDYWRNRAHAAMDAENELAGLALGLRRRCDALERTNVRLASRLEQAELHISEESAIDRREIMVVGGRCANSPSRGRHLCGGGDMAKRTPGVYPSWPGARCECDAAERNRRYAKDNDPRHQPLDVCVSEDGEVSCRFCWDLIAEAQS